MVGHLDEEFQVGVLVADGRDPRREFGGIYQGPGLRIVEQIHEFGLDVAVIDVDGCDPGPVGADHRFQVLVAVAQVHPNVILAGFVTLQPVAFRVATQAQRRKVVCDTVHAGVELRVGPFAAPPDQCPIIGKRLCQSREHRRQVEAAVTHDTL